MFTFSEVQVRQDVIESLHEHLRWANESVELCALFMYIYIYLRAVFRWVSKVIWW